MVKADLLFFRFGGHKGGGSLDEVASVVAEVTRLLNTRAPFFSNSAGLRRTVLEYGMPDFSHYSPCSRRDAQLLANLIRETISAYEPRLVVDSVTVDAPRPCRDALSAFIVGSVWRRDCSLVSVGFPVAVGISP